MAPAPDPLGPFGSGACLDAPPGFSEISAGASPGVDAQRMKRLLMLLTVLVSLVAFPVAANAAKPVITHAGAIAFKDGGEAKVSVVTMFERGNSVRIVSCLVRVTRNSTCVGGLQKVYSPSMTCKTPNYCGWMSKFRVKLQRRVSGYVVVANSDGSVRKNWSARVIG